MNSKFWMFSEPEEGEAELRLDGPISSETWWGDEVTPRMFRDELAQHPGDITVWINSPGGDVFAASSIYTALKEHKGRVTVKVEALAASAASIVAMAGDLVLIAPTAFLMIHRASSIAWGDSEEMRHAARDLDEVDHAIAQIYADKTGMDADRVYGMMAKETWMNAQSALDNGFVDGILYQEDDEPAPLSTPDDEPAGNPLEQAAALASRPFAASSNVEAFLLRFAEWKAERHLTTPAPEPEPTVNAAAETRARLRLKLKLLNDMIEMGGD